MEKQKKYMSSPLHYFSGDFMSSYTTAHEQTKNIRHLEQQISQLIICGNIVVTNIKYDENPLTDNSIPPVKIGDELAFVEFREQDPIFSKRRNIFDYTISSIRISDFQEINGIPHGILTGKITGCIVKREPIKEKEPNLDVNSTASDTIDNNLKDNQNLSDRRGCGANPLNNPTNLLQNNGCGRLLAPITLATNKGCGNVAIPGLMPNGCRNSGCWSIFLFLIWIPILFSLLRFCNRENEDDNRMPKVEDTKRAYWEDKLDKDFQIDSTKKIDDTYEIQYKSILLPNVQFFTNSNKILEYSKKELDELSLYLNENQELKAIVYGYTDNKGGTIKNLKLSQKRAEAVVNYLIDKGVQSSRLSAVGKGESDPRASNELKEGRLMNRRVEITIIKNVKRK